MCFHSFGEINEQAVTGRYRRGQIMKFYTIKLPKFLGGIVRAMLGSFRKD
ncbi:stage V sporulation protein M [Bacillus tequilensis]|nr:stage V sporulation protein M [Bacillus tequilensis]